MAPTNRSSHEEGSIVEKEGKGFRWPFDDAVARWGIVKLKALAGSPSTFSNWKSRGYVPGDIIAQLLWEETGGAGRRDGPWDDPAWRLGRTYTKCIEQMARLAHGDRWGDLYIISAILDRLSPWKEEDWRKLFEGGMDRLPKKEATGVGV